MSQDGFQKIIDIEYDYDKCQKMKNGFIEAIYQDGDNYSQDHLQLLWRKATEMIDNKQQPKENQSTDKTKTTKQSKPLGLQQLPDSVQCYIGQFVNIDCLFKQFSIVSLHCFIQ